MTDRQEHGLADYFREFGKVHVAQLSPLYAVLSAHVAETPGLLYFASQATPGQPPANLLFAAVQYHLRRAHPDHPLAEYYPTLRGARAPDTEVGPLFENFVKENEEALRTVISSRITNTNEVGRCGVLVTAFALAGQEARAPLHMVEIGPSVGLNLCWDAFGYRFGDVHWNEGAALTFEPELRGPVPLHLSGGPPTVASRTGIELNPAPIADDDTYEWQQALVFPEHVDRLARLGHAFQAARDAAPDIVAGDATMDLAGLLDRLPADQPTVVYHSLVTYQISKAGRQALHAQLCEASMTRPLWRVEMEWLVSGAAPAQNGDIALAITRFAQGHADFRHLGFCDPHGRWLDWRAE